ncbi:MAG: hypothetical protein ACK4K2_04235 [Dehalococcoidia bacterium]
MKLGNLITAVAATTLLGSVLVLLTACSGGVSRAEFDALKQQLAAKEQEVATAKQQLASLQQTTVPTPREPKRLEAKITIVMGEEKGKEEMFFATPEGVKGGPFRLPAGKTVGIHFVNKGEVTHEFMIGRTLKLERGEAHGYEVSLLEKVAADLFAYYPVSGKMRMVEVGGAEFEEVELEPGAEVWLRIKIPEELKGEWEVGCFIKEPDKKSHYEQGMKAKLIVE